MMKRPSLNDQGFTLIELLTAVVILIFGILAVSTMQISAIQGNTVANRTTQATNIAQFHAEEILSWSFDDVRTTTTNNITHDSYTVNYTVTPNTPKKDATSITVSVVWQNKAGNNSDVSTTFIKTKY